MKLGIIGLGRWGTMIAEAAAFFGMEVAYHNRTKKQTARIRIWRRQICLAAVM